MASRTLSAPINLFVSMLFALAIVFGFTAIANAAATPVSCTDLGGTESGDDCLLDGDSFGCIDDSQIDI
ncbi:MAG: hypothetical protein Q8R92_17825, partial [Deltaproteobacteria bacterium]|nr:hypothetical protein [Deltaproteobacteria bacterium]